MENTTKKKKSRSKELGASLVEYGLLIALVALIAVPAVRVLGQNIDSTLKEAAKLGAADFTCDPFAGPCPP